MPGHSSRTVKMLVLPFALHPEPVEGPEPASLLRHSERSGVRAAGAGERESPGRRHTRPTTPDPRPSAQRQTNTPNTPVSDSTGLRFSQTNRPVEPDSRASYNAPVTHTILFDVDHTLLYSGGAGGLAMGRAFHQLHGIENAFRNIEGSGRTDWSILKRGLQTHDLFDEAGDFNATIASFIDAYVEHLATTLRQAPGGHIKAGVPQLLDALAQRDDVQLGLATGNFKRTCLLKLEYYELNAHLREGGFGEDAEDRGDMVACAIKRVSNGSEPDNIWVVGDTPRDIQAAQANNVRSLAVATGDNSLDELIAAGADVALKDLADTEEVLRVVFG